jgi:hypothetical protein
MFLAGPVAYADNVHFEALLSGLNEVPPNASPGFGSATAILNPVTNELCVHLDFGGLVAPVSAAHVHNAPPGVNGPVFLPLLLPAPSDTCGIITDANEAAVLAGNAYVNVHSQTFPGGEIRGQLGKVPEPATAALLGLGALAVIRRRR